MCLICRLKEICKKNCNSVAIKYDNKQYTYSEMDKITDTIASNIIDSGISQRTRIGVLFERNANAVLAMLGIVKAGCIYAPLSRQNPVARTEKMLEVANVQYVICEDDSMSFKNCRKIRFEDLLQEHRGRIIPIFDTEELYTIFTSGTTGFPKSFDITKAAIVNLVESITEKYWATEKDTYHALGELAEFVFDMSQGQIYLALLNGKTLDIIPNKVKNNPRLLAQYLSEREIDHCDITPTLLDVFIRYIENNKIMQRFPRMWTTSGEKLPMELAKRVIQNTHCKIANSYGPAEACVYVSVFVLDEKNVNCFTDAPIGVPIHNTFIAITDEFGNIVEDDVEGEIVISGIGLTKGYLNLPDITQKCFVRSEGEITHVRYKTGDLGIKSSEDGLLYCFGRLDQQIKYHGIRIELDEIKNYLLQKKEVSSCLITSYKKSNRIDLVAYYVADCKISEEELYDHLKFYLPVNLIPNYFVQIDQLPTMISGKIDYKALPDYKLYVDREEPVNEGDEEVDLDYFLKMIGELLNTNCISSHDNFFLKGGDSLTFINLIVSIEEYWKISVSYDELYRCTSIEEMYQYICAGEKKKMEEGDGQIEYNRAELTPFQLDIIKAEDTSADYPTHNIVQSICVDHYLDSNRLKEAVEYTVRQFDSLRASFAQENGKYYLQLNTEIGEVFEYRKNVLSLDNDYIRKYISSFRYDEKSLIRIILLEDIERRQKIILNAHHAIFDYVSILIFIKYVFRIYGGSFAYRPKSYFEYLNRTKDVEYQKKKAVFWKKYYQGREKAAYFPMQNNANEKNTGHSIYNTKWISLEKNIIRKIQQSGKKYGLTCFQIILAAWALVIMWFTGRKDIIIGTFLPGRHKNYYDSIGLFTNCVGIRFLFESDVTQSSYLEMVKKQIRAIWDYQDTDLREVFRYLRMQDLIKGELFGIIVNYHSCISFSEDISGTFFHVAAEDISKEPHSHPLNITAYEYSEKIDINICYNTKFYDDNFIDKIIKKKKKSVEFLSIN